MDGHNLLHDRQPPDRRQALTQTCFQQIGVKTNVRYNNQVLTATWNLAVSKKKKKEEKKNKKKKGTEASKGYLPRQLKKIHFFDENFFKRNREPIEAQNRIFGNPRERKKAKAQEK